MCSAVPDSRESRGDGSNMGEDGRRGVPYGSVLLGGHARPATVPATSTDATRNPSWSQVLATTIRLWLSRRMPRVSIEWPDRSVSSAAVGHAGLVPVMSATADPSWGLVLVTTIRLWLSRRMPRVSIEWQHVGRPDGSRFNRPAWAHRRFSAGGLARSLSAAAKRGSFGRVLAASTLGLGLLAVGAGTVGVVVASSAGAAVRLPARPAPVRSEEHTSE